MSSRESMEVHGILAMDKPRGLTSNRLLQKVKWLFKARKAGHTGSLDPLATGVLPICFGEATKISRFLLDADKTYVADIRLGSKTDTGDATGTVVERILVSGVSREKLLDVLSRFEGDTEQVPPMYSALKRNGRPLYAYARKGEVLERDSRRISIFSLRLLEFGEDWLRIHVRCSKGTYIRTLAEDIGIALGVCAHLENLRRIQLGSFSLDNAVSIDRLEALAARQPDFLPSLLESIDGALGYFPEVMLQLPAAKVLQQGRSIQLTPTAPREWVRIYAEPGRIFLGLGELTGAGVLVPRRMMNMGLT